MFTKRILPLNILIIVSCFYFSCNSKTEVRNNETGVNNPADNAIAEKITSLSDSVSKNNGKLNDSVRFRNFMLVKQYYSKRDYKPSWCLNSKWLNAANQLVSYLDTSIREGLFKEDYHYSALRNIYLKTKYDSLHTLGTSAWAEADLMMTESFFGIIRDLKQGRLQDDSLCWENIPDKSGFFMTQIGEIEKGKDLHEILNSLQPQYADYKNLKNGIKRFVDSMSDKKFTYVKYPYEKGDEDDSLLFVQRLHKRLVEEGFTKYSDIKTPDSTSLAEEISWCRKKRGMSDDNKLGGLISDLNYTDREKLIRIAITLDRYKQLKSTLPDQYVCVNLPGFHLRVKENDTTKLYSKIICGRPYTRTPFINSAIDEIVTYPTWTVPSSIVRKEMLPGLKRNSSYLSKKGLHLLDNNGARLDPGSINWSNYKSGIPFRIQQSSGDNNALGVIKFNFPNDFSVYLHDTNQRSLFGKSNRALSHGCVRVQEWKELALYLIRNDSIKITNKDTLFCNSDSLENWLAKKQRKKIPVKNKMPVFIWYYTCEGIDNKISFYNDIYDEDKTLRDKYFANK